MMDLPKPPRLEARGLTKRYGHVVALDGADFTAYAGEIVALVGDNGAGKSTLVKCLSGALQPDAGEILLEGAPVRLSSPAVARECGLETVYQDLALAADLTPAANLFLGRELMRDGVLGRLGVLDDRAMRAQAQRSLDELGIRLQDTQVSVGSLSGGQRQAVAIARAVAWASDVVFLDEPTAALGVAQRERVLEIAQRVRDGGRAVVLISHNLPEVLAVADRVQVLRRGRRVAQFRAADASLEGLVGAMTGAVAAGGE